MRNKDIDGQDLMAPGDAKRFKAARNGDHFMCPFMCDLCHFRRLKWRDPDSSEASDELTLLCIRRANLDAFWSREPGTVAANLREIKSIINSGELLGIDMLGELGPFPFRDCLGMRPAMAFLLKSRRGGRHDPEQIKYSSARKVRGAFTNYYHASKEQVEALSFTSGRGHQYASCSITNGLWYSRFQEGVHCRMGDTLKQGLAISIGVMLKLQEYFETDYQMSTGIQRRRIVEAAVFAETSYCISLRGFEVPKMDLGGLRENRVQPEDSVRTGLAPHVGVPLVGRFKAEKGEQCHIIPMAAETHSGLKPLLWINRLIEEREAQGRVKGWAFVDENGEQVAMNYFAETIYDYLVRIQECCPQLINPGINVLEEVGLARSFRRGSNSQAQNRGVPPEIVDRINRWRTEERAKGKASASSMRVLYADTKLLLDMYLRYSSSL
jgi:hypothetical protein